jgi:hypothetical protein
MAAGVGVGVESNRRRKMSREAKRAMLSANIERNMASPERHAIRLERKLIIMAEKPYQRTSYQRNRHRNSINAPGANKRRAGKISRRSGVGSGRMARSSLRAYQ